MSSNPYASHFVFVRIHDGLLGQLDVRNLEDGCGSVYLQEHQPKSLIVRIEPHAKGEVFTLDRIESDGRAISSSTVLYFDGAPREFEDFGCSGTQSSRRLDSQTMEILRVCATGEWIWLIRQSAVKSQELTIDITEKRDGRSNVEWRVVLKKQEVPNQ